MEAPGEEAAGLVLLQADEERPAGVLISPLAPALALALALTLSGWLA